MNTPTRVEKQKSTLTVAMMFVCVLVVFFVLFLKQDPVIPVQNASSDDWNQDSFWFEPWGISGVHKGIDIFARKGTAVLAAVLGVVVYTNELELGGKVIIIIGPKWQLHYYAHLDTVAVTLGQWVQQSAKIGSIGNSGNARNKPSHLHYSILSLIPDPKRYSSQTQGWKKMFYLNPDEHLRQLKL